MNRNLRAWTAVGILCLPGYYFWNRLPSPDASQEFASWSPDAAAIQRELDTRHPGNPDTPERRRLFIEMFQQRYRRHDPPIAVGIKFLPQGSIKLMCPARMEPWQIDRLTAAAWRETRQVLGKTFPIDIYETYIGATPRKIGFLAPRPDAPSQAHITYDFSHQERHPTSRSALFRP